MGIRVEGKGPGKRRSWRHHRAAQRGIKRELQSPSGRRQAGRESGSDRSSQIAAWRPVLAAAVGNTIKAGLAVLGIEVLEEM